jgi:hypothetical protein
MENRPDQDLDAAVVKPGEDIAHDDRAVAGQAGSEFQHAPFAGAAWGVARCLGQWRRRASRSRLEQAAKNSDPLARLVPSGKPSLTVRSRPGR